MFLDYFFFKSAINQSIIPTLAGQSWCYSYDPVCQVAKSLPPVLKTLVCHGHGSNRRPLAHKEDALTTRPPRRSVLHLKLTKFTELGRKDKECS